MLITRSAARRGLAGVAVVACAATWAPPAFARNGFSFDQFFDGTATVGAAPLDVVRPRRLRLDLVRGGAVIATDSRFGYFVQADLRQPLAAGDVARLFQDSTMLGSATYDGLPAINADACIGASSFTATRAANATVDDAGAFTPGASPYGPRTRSIFTRDNPFRVTLDTPIAAGQAAFATTRIDTADLLVESTRSMSAGVCPAPPPPPITQPGTRAPTDAQVAQAVRSALASTRRALGKLNLATLARRKTVALSFAFSEAGAAKLQLTAKVKGKTVTIGSGAKTAAAPGTAKISVKLTAAGRRALRNARTLKLTLKGTFTPARAGAKPQTASTSVTLKRKKKP